VGGDERRRPWGDVRPPQRLAPVRSVGTAEDLAHAVCLMLTNGFATGTVLAVDASHRLTAP